MNILRVAHYMKRAAQLGPRKTTAILHARVTSWLTDRQWRRLAHQKKAHHTWVDIQKALNFTTSSSEYVNTLLQSQAKFIALRSQFFKTNLSDLYTQADSYTQQCFDLLGSGKQCFDKIPWHIDFRLASQNSNSDTSFDSSLFFRDIKVKVGLTEALEKDIKIPWDLSRLHHFFILGCAYQETHNSTYYEAFLKQLCDWKKNNPFLLGPNWLCPMDVGIRAANLVWALYLFADPVYPQVWIADLLCLLYDHLFYLEHTWEIYDGRTSNHYLSDLVGYLYCCSVFKNSPIIMKKIAWCRQELMQELEKQVFDEGADYEGSTRYHILVTELFFHGALICDYLNVPMPAAYQTKLRSMFEFIDWCTPHNGTPIMIGDNDSGTVISGISHEFVTSMVAPPLKIKKEFTAFGISILKTQDWHISLRHHAYNPRQPSGHFHNDVGSITLNYKGKDIFIDPGSYVYTPSAVWRNRFRSVKMHNTVWLNNEEPVAFYDHLFGLNIPSAKFSSPSCDAHSLITAHRLYASLGFEVHRALHLNLSENFVTIHDSFKPLFSDKKNCLLSATWNFTLGPTIKPCIIENNVHLQLSDGKQMLIQTNLSFHIVPSWVSYTYGSKVPTYALQAYQNINCSEAQIIQLSLIS